MKIPETNAFTINLLSSSFFPLSVDVSQKEGITSAFLCAQRVLDVCDLVEKYATEDLILFNVGQTSLYDEHEARLFSLQRIATHVNVPFSTIDSETIVLAKEALKPLLSDFDHYNLFAMDVGRKWSESDVINYVITCAEHDWRTPEFLLSKLPASQNLILSHDDCYLTVQTRNPSFVKQLFARTLQIYTGTVLSETNARQFDVSEIPVEIFSSFWEENFGLTILRETTEFEKHGLKMGVARKSFSFRESTEYIPEFWIRYELASQQWTIEK